MLRMDQDKTSSVTAAVSKKKQPLSTAMKRTSEWILSQDVPNDITVLVCGAAFDLNKVPSISYD